MGQIFGPELGLEVQLLGRERSDLSVSFETYNVVNGWLFQSFTTLNTVHLTVPASEKVLLNASMTAGYGPSVSVSDGEAAFEDEVLLQPEVGVNVALSDKAAFVGTARTYVTGWQLGVPNATVGGIFAFGSEFFGCSGGLNLVYGGLQGPFALAGANGSGNVDSSLAVVPWPHAQLWVRI